MTIKDTLNLILETREDLIEDYQYLYKKSPDNQELLNHAKQIVKDNNIEELLSDVLIDDTINVYKLLLLSAATSNLKE